MWISTSAKVLRGMNRIRRDVRSHDGPVPDETLTGWIVRMMAQYRENKKIRHRIHEGAETFTCHRTPHTHLQIMIPATVTRSRPNSDRG
jgi:hypothetical protein